MSGTPVSASRASGRKILTQDIRGFNLQQYQSRGTVGGKTVGGSGDSWGNVQNLQIMEIGIQIRVTPPKGAPFLTGYVTTIRGRNN